jgi:hypothetical protein
MNTLTLNWNRWKFFWEKQSHAEFELRKPLTKFALITLFSSRAFYVAFSSLFFTLSIWAVIITLLILCLYFFAFHRTLTWERVFVFTRSWGDQVFHSTLDEFRELFWWVLSLCWLIRFDEITDGKRSLQNQILKFSTQVFLNIIDFFGINTTQYFISVI